MANHSATAALRMGISFSIRSGWTVWMTGARCGGRSGAVSPTRKALTPAAPSREPWALSGARRRGRIWSAAPGLSGGGAGPEAGRGGAGRPGKGSPGGAVGPRAEAIRGRAAGSHPEPAGRSAGARAFAAVLPSPFQRPELSGAASEPTAAECHSDGNQYHDPGGDADRPAGHHGPGRGRGHLRGACQLRCSREIR